MRSVALIAGEDPGWGGIGTYTGILASALRDLGLRVHMVLRGWEEDGRTEEDGIAVHRVAVPEPSWRRGTEAVVSRLYVARESLVFSARVARVLAGLAREEGVHVAEAPEFHAPGLAAALIARTGRGPALVTRLHMPSHLTERLDDRGPSLDMRAVELLEHGAARSGAAITCPSASLAALVSRRWRLGPGRVKVIPNPVDADHFRAREASHAEPGSVLVVGRIERNKGQDLVVEALPALRRSDPRAHLRLVGQDGAPREGVSPLAALHARAARLGLPPDAIRADGPVQRRELADVYRRAAVCVVPSRFDNFPYTCLEAMACGRAVVATRAGGAAEMIDHGRDGMLVPPGDPAALAGAIGGLLADPARARRLGEAARATVEQRYAEPVVARHMTDLYRAVLER